MTLIIIDQNKKLTTGRLCELKLGGIRPLGGKSLVGEQLNVRKVLGTAIGCGLIASIEAEEAV